MTSSKSASPKAQHTYLHFLKLSLWAGAAYDVAFAAAMFLIPAFAADLMGLRLPGDPYYLQLIAVLLLMLATMYLFAAYDPKAYAGNIAVAIVGRFLGFCVLLYHALTDPTLPGLYMLAFSDLLFAVVHAVFWWPIRR